LKYPFLREKRRKEREKSLKMSEIKPKFGLIYNSIDFLLLIFYTKLVGLPAKFGKVEEKRWEKEGMYSLKIALHV